jgi:hypothetical protein
LEDFFTLIDVIVAIILYKSMAATVTRADFPIPSLLQPHKKATMPIRKIMDIPPKRLEYE